MPDYCIRFLVEDAEALEHHIVAVITPLLEPGEDLGSGCVAVEVEVVGPARFRIEAAAG